MQKHFFLFTFLHLFCISLFGQQYKATIKHYTEKDGLSNNDVLCIKRDTRGVLWVGTRYGLNRFDGKVFRSFTHSDGLANNLVNAIYTVSNRYLLLGLGSSTESQLLIKNFQLFDYFTNRFVSLETVFAKLPFSTQEILYIEPLGEQLIFVLKSKKQYLFDGQTNFRLLAHLKAGEKLLALAQENAIWVVIENMGNMYAQKRDAMGHLIDSFWVGIKNEFSIKWLRNDVEGNQYFTYVSNRSDDTHILKVGRDGVKNIIKNFNIKDKNYYFSTTTLEYAPNRAQYWAINDKEGVLFSENWDVLFEIANPNKRFINQARQNYFDADGFWQCSSMGLYHILPHHHHIETLFSEQEAVSFRAIWRLGEYLFMNSEVGLYQIDNKGNTKIWRDKLGLAATLTKTGSAWTGNFLNLHHIQTNYQIITYHIPSHEPWAMWTEANGNLWFSHKGVKIFNPTDSSISSIDYNGFDALSTATVYYFYPLSDKRLWLCATSGLYEVDIDQKKVMSRYWSGGKGSYYLPTDDLRHLYRDTTTGEVWIATGQVGLLRWRPAHNATQLFSFPKHATNITHSVYTDNHGFLWLSTDNGLIQWQLKTNRFRIYTVDDGLKTNEFNRISHFQDADGTLYWGSVAGVVRLHPKHFYASFERAIKDPPILIEVQQYDERTDTIVDKTEDWLLQHQLVIKPYNRFFRLILACTNNVQPEDITYYYQLEGDAIWQKAEGNQITFWRLPYGNQIIHIKTQYANGDFSKIQTVPVSVLPPFYLRWWFIVLTVMFAAVGVYAWINSLKNRNRKLEEEVHRRTEKIAQQTEALKELDELKSRFFANISHELRTPITLILNPLSHLLSYKNWEQDKQKLLLTAQKNSQKLLRLVNEILDLTKLEATSLQLEIREINLLSFIKRIVGKSKKYCFNVNIYVI